jgi:hypothetical protein
MCMPTKSEFNTLSAAGSAVSQPSSVTYIQGGWAFGGTATGPHPIPQFLWVQTSSYQILLLVRYANCSLWWTGYNFPWITYGGASSATHCTWHVGAAESPVVVPAGRATVPADASFIWKSIALFGPLLHQPVQFFFLILSRYFVRSHLQRMPHRSPVR